MKNINDLLQEISSSKFCKKSDNELLQTEGQTKWSYDKVYPIWKDYYDNKIGSRLLTKKYGISFSTLKKRFIAYNLPIVDCTQSIAKNKILSNPRHLDIINGMSKKEWTKKYGTDSFWVYQQVLKKHGMI